MKDRDAPPPRRPRKPRSENHAPVHRDRPSPRRTGKPRPSQRDRLPRGRRSGKTITSIKPLRKQRLRPSAKEKQSRESAPLKKSDIAPKKFHDRDPSNDLRPVRDYELARYNAAYREDELSQRKVPEKSDLYFLDYMHEVNEKYRSMHHDDLLLKKESQSDRREVRYPDESSSRRTAREKHDKYSRSGSPPRKYAELDKYERRFRELSPYRKNETFDNFSKYDGSSFPSNSRAEKYDKYSSHENHSSSRRNEYIERSRKHDDEFFSSKNNALLPKHRDRYPDRLTPLMDKTFLLREPSSPRRLINDKYDRRKDMSVSRLPSLFDKLPNFEQSPKRYDKHNSESYPRRRDIPEERQSRNHISSPRRKYTENPPSRPSSRSYVDRHDKYSHNNVSPTRRNPHNDKYNSPPPPPRRSETDRHRRPRDFSPHAKPPPPERRERPPSPRRNSRPEKREKFSTDFLPPREPHSDKRSDRYYDPGEPSRSNKPPIFTRKSTHDRFEKPVDSTKKHAPPRLDKRDRHLAEMAQSSKNTDLRDTLKRPSRPERLPEQYTRRDAKPLRNAPPPAPNSKRKRSGDDRRPPKRRPRSPPREKREKYPQQNSDTRIIKFRKPRPKPDKESFDERW